MLIQGLKHWCCFSLKGQYVAFCLHNLYRNYTGTVRNYYGQDIFSNITIIISIICNLNSNKKSINTIPLSYKYTKSSKLKKK